MGLLSRLLLFFRIKTNVALDAAEDPREVMDYAAVQQQEILRKVNLGLIEVATSKRRLEQQSGKLSSRIELLADQARRAIQAGREDLARTALERRQTAMAEIDGLRSQTEEVGKEEQRLTTAQRKLSARIEEFRVRREVAGARYTAAEAQVRVHEALTGITGELADLSMALGRAEEKMERMQARASALDSLLESGALTSPIAGGDPLERQLRDIAANYAIEQELAALRPLLPTASSTGGNAPEERPGA